ncbi:MAG: ABC transporter permease [Gemmatimonadota bacterium]
MSLWRQVTRGARTLWNRRTTDREIRDEVQHYLDQATDFHRRRGLDTAEALRAARLDLGGETQAAEQVREYGWENIVETTLADLRYAARRLRRNPGFSVVIILTLALGLGATTAIFSAVNPVLFAPLPYPEPERIARIADQSSDGSPVDVTFGTYRELLQRSHTFASMAVFKPWHPTMVGSAEPERLDGQRVGASYFRALGIPPALGRDFSTADDRERGPNVVILSNALWRRRFASDAGAIGRTIRLDDTDFEIIGVMPGSFENVLAPRSELWAPMQFSLAFGPNDREWGHQLRLLGRLRPGITMSDAALELNAIARTPLPEFPRVPWAALSSGLGVTSLQLDVTRGVRPALLAVLGAVLLVLGIACVNVTNLLLARGAQREGEFAMRAALGAARLRVIRQLLTESLLLAFVGGALGLLVAIAGVRALVALTPAGLPRTGAIRVDGTAFAFGMVVTTIVGLIVGLIPAMQASRKGLHGGLQRGSSRSAGGHRTTRRALVVAEVALALVLLVSAGLLLRSIGQIFAVPVGFDASQLLTMQIQETGQRFQTDTARSRFYRDALEAVHGVPGVTAAGLTSTLPLSGDLDVYGVHFESDQGPADDGGAIRYSVTPEYFEAMGIPLLRGRLPDAHDGPDAPRAVVLNQSFAARKFGRQDPIGQRLRFGPDDGRWYTIVGIVGDVRQSSFDADHPDAVYLSSTQWHWVDNLMSLVVRGRGDPARLASGVRAAVWSVDKDQPIVRVATMSELVDRSVADRHFALILFEAFGAVALVLAATGIYGVLSGSVTERLREIGVRSALGASRGDILALILREGLRLTGLGVMLGIAGAVASSRALVSLLFKVSPLDPLTYSGVVALLALVSILACWLPARRAAGVDPAITLRGE